MDRINEYYKNALLDNLCTEYKGYWAAAHGDKEKLLKLSLQQQALPHVCTYAYQGKGLTKEYLLKEYSYFINGYTVRDADGVEGFTYGLYVDYYYDNALIAKQDVLSLMWCEGTNVIVPKCKCSTLYISNKSNVRVSCDGYNNVRIYLFDESKLILDDIDDQSSVLVYRYDDKATVELSKFCLSEKVRIFNKELRL